MRKFDYFVGQTFRTERKQKMRERLQRWKESGTGEFDKLWESLKRDILTKQEN